MKKFNMTSWILFLVPSLLGILLFMTPMKFDGEWKVPIAVFANALAGQIAPIMPIVALIILIVAAVGSVIYAFRPANEKVTIFTILFKVTPFWVITRVIAALFAISVVFQIGPEIIWEENTGGLLLSEEGLVTFLFTVFLFAGLLLPLLLNFGLLEFFGTLMVKVMRPLFKLPGRSSIDALASWVGDGTIGVLLTSKQYEEGHYTKKEAAIIGTTFSVVSITFAIVIIGEVGLDAYFIPYYLTVAFVGFILALIMPRIYPLAQKGDEYIDGTPYKGDEELVPEGHTSFSLGLEKALEKAETNKSLSKTVFSGIQNVLDMWIGVIPVVMAFGTLALIFAEHTSVFNIIGKPFEPYLQLLNIPEAAEAAPLMVIGFTDMFLPVILASGTITSQLTLFVVATMSVVQLIFLAEVGGLLLGSKIPVSFLDLVVIFLLRTIIALPIVAGVAHLLF